MKFLTSRSLVLFAIIFALTVGTSASGASGWTSVRSKNFFLVGDASEVQLKDAAARLEQFRNALSQLLPEVRFDVGVRTNVIVFKDSATYRAFKPKRPDGTPDDAVAGYFLAGDDVNYITLSAAPDKGDPFHTINHEYVHFLLRSNFGAGIPRWLDEGIAEYFETLQITDTQHILLGRASESHILRLKSSSLIPLKTLLATDGAELHKRGDDPRNLFYAESWALVHFLIQRDGIEKIVSMARSGSSVPDSDLEAMEKALPLYIQQAELPVSTTAAKVSAAVSDSTSGTVSDADSNAYLGDLLYHADRLAEAEPYLRKAVALDPNSPLGRMSLGLLLMRKDNFQEARKHLEFAISRDKTNHLAYFNYAYAISREAEDPNGLISGYSDEDAAKMRTALLKAMEIEPKFAESYRLLAFLDFVNDTNLEEAESLLKKGLSLRPSHPDFEILLAKVELAREKYTEARQLAEKLLRSSNDLEIKKDADEILKTIGQYTKARIEVLQTSNIAPPWVQSLLFLKRSWLTEADVAKIDRDREINNLNRALERPAADEKQILGTVNGVTCSEGSIDYDVISDGKQMRFTSRGFQKLRMAVLLEGEHSFQIECGVNFSKYLTVLAYRSGLKPNSKPELTSITFVPDYFKLKSPAEIASIRMVVVEDDRLRRGRSAGTIERPNIDESRSDTRFAAIYENLRRPQNGEVRVIGTLERVDCRGAHVSLEAMIGGKRFELIADAPNEVKVSWFGVEASQVPLLCGSEPMMTNTVLTFVPATAGGILKAVEFVPEGFTLSKN